MSDRVFDFLAIVCAASLIFLVCAAAVYNENAKVWCAQEGKKAVVGFFIHTCVTERP